MGANELAIRFTDEKYLTKNDLIKELKMNIVDGIWSGIQSYRSNFNQYLQIKSLERNQFLICLCALLNNNVASLNVCENRLLKETGFIPSTSEDRIFKNNNLAQSLLHIARKNDITISKSMLLAKLNEENISLNNENSTVINYFEALKIAMNYKGDINGEFMNEIYCALSGANRISNLYRTSISDIKVNNGAPSIMIQMMIDSLFEFVENSSLDKYLIAGIVLYYINYVQPFPSFNSEVAIILFKSIISRDIGSIAFNIPYEALIEERIDNYTKVIQDSSKTTDVTYFCLYIINFVNELYESLIDYTIKLKVDGVKEDFYRKDEVKPDEEVEQKAPVIINEQKAPSTSDPSLENIVVKEEKSNKVKPEPIKPVTKSKEALVEKSLVGGLAFDFSEAEIDEKQLKKNAKHLLEIDPLLSKKEATFYVRHCTIGKMYSISQFQNEIGTVYETARTSMEHLATLGYYKKEQIKNKFFYSPILKR